LVSDSSDWDPGSPSAFDDTREKYAVSPEYSASKSLWDAYSKSSMTVIRR